jgi:4-hydroxy-3-polyprenylbenzoate decarboxylase
MGFYGGVEDSPLVRFHCMTQRRSPIFLTTFSGRPPKEEAMLAIALNRIYTPILRQQIPEIRDFFLPMEALSYKLAVISIDKAYPGQAKRAAMAFWSALPQFTYTKFVVVVDKHINVRDPRQVVWAIAAQVDPQRDLFVLENTPFDTLDFASEQLGLGGRMAVDATTKIGPDNLTWIPHINMFINDHHKFGISELWQGTPESHCSSLCLTWISLVNRDNR